MSTLGYYCNNNLPIIKECEEAWGGKCQSLNQVERLWVAMKLIEAAIAEIDPNEQVRIYEGCHEVAVERISEIPTEEKIAFATALLNFS